MKEIFKFTRDTRKAFIQLIDTLSIEQLNEIPDRFNNNIVWNFGHIVVTAPILCYVRSGIWQDASTLKYAQAYAKGSRPTYFVSSEEVADLKKLALESIDNIEADYKAGKFTSIAPFETASYGNKLETIEDILTMSVGHDNLHFGYAAAQKKIINNK